VTQVTQTPPRPPVQGVSIVGIGASGVAAARLALAQGETVHVTDIRTDPDAQARARELRELGADVELGSHDLDRIQASHTLVVSPGIPPHAPVLESLRARGVSWIGEPEFAVRFLTGELIAVTGTNGKTTTVLLLAHLLRQAGLRAAAGGNVGGGLAPAASELALMDPTPDVVVLEMSSFQLADTRDFAPTLGIVTSLAPDHLDRYPNVETYWADKARLFQNARPTDRWILNGDAAAVRALPGKAAGVRLYFSRASVDAAAFLHEGILTLRIPESCGGTGQEEPLLSAAELPLLGAHNHENALAASLAARLLGASPASIAEGLRQFTPLPHRLAPIGVVGGARWVNDSKATNVSATVSAIESLAEPLVVLLGGKDKGEDFAPLAAPLRAKARAVVCYGEAGGRLLKALEAAYGSHSPVVIRSVTGTFDEALGAARALAQPGDLVLLSPACSSFDQFRNYEARGERFAAVVQGWMSEESETAPREGLDLAPEGS
jgi:UDP-N-acetylmuramoylalanine--D-glutamate ligase